MNADVQKLVAENRSWKRDFSAATLQRGERYAEQGLVQIQSHGESRIDSTCRGSGGNVYRQRIIITARPSGQCHVRGNCSCPVGENCKHCAAALYTLASSYGRGAASGEQLPHHLQHWLQGLEQPLSLIHI